MSQSDKQCASDRTEPDAPATAVPLAAICRDLPGFTGAGSAYGSITSERGQAERMEIKMATATAIKPSAPKHLPPPNSDFYQLAEMLSDDEMAVLKKVRAFMETNVTPIINKYWVEDAFPFELLPAFKELKLPGVGIEGYGCFGGRPL